MYQKLEEAAQYITSQKKCRPQVGVILGSGLGVFVEHVEDKSVIPYNDIPHFPSCTVEGHEGCLILGKLGGVEVAVLQGRFHAYEGHPMEDVVLPTRLLARLGADRLILTNAAGGINKNFKPGDLVMITDHINLMGRNPLQGPNIDELGPRFPDMSYAYHPSLREILRSAATEIGYELAEGVYAGVLGPTYETPAEVRMLEIVGADMVGMSTVPESIAANHLGIKVCAISCITNMAAGIEKGELKHEDVKQQALRVMQDFSKLLTAAIAKMAK